ncbi:hypothetical protein [Tropicimonas sp. S265A]|uniref:hypothetical protein n=1 Tax=Tropicimonas sp. S265A TaxID=3415134 RepID=UPI003C7A0955
MTDRPAEPDPLAPLIATLHEGRRPRVWSMIVTVFGDAIVPRGGELPLARLQVLMARIGVEAGTTRTALSRLGRDGWVTRRRIGRASLYNLSDRALAETLKAMDRIYAPPETSDTWALHLGAAPNGHALQIGPAAWLAPVMQAPSPPATTGYLQDTPSRPLPDAILSPEHRQARDLLVRDLAVLPPEQAVDLTPLEAMAARVLLMHRWRRYALRFPQPLPGTDPRAEVAAAYAALFPASEAWLDSAADGLDPMVPFKTVSPPRFGRV